MRARARLLIRDVTKQPEMVHPANLDHGVCSIAAYPIVGQNERVLGVLVLYYTAAQAFGETATAAAGLLPISSRRRSRTRGSTRRRRRSGAARADLRLDLRRDPARQPRREIQAANRRPGNCSIRRELVISVRLSQLAAGRRSDQDRVFDDLGAILQKPDQGADGDLDLQRAAGPSTGSGVRSRTRPAPVGFTLTLHDVTHERQVSQMKTDFVSFVTHQLRTPLAGIKWMLELAAQRRGFPTSEQPSRTRAPPPSG